MTSNERIVVAESLRHARGIRGFVDVLGVNNDSDWTWDDVNKRVADLIDPTCQDFGGEEGTNGEGYDFACSACGYVCDLPQPNYCPNCGARLVRDNDK